MHPISITLKQLETVNSGIFKFAQLCVKFEPATFLQLLSARTVVYIISFGVLKHLF